MRLQQRRGLRTEQAAIEIAAAAVGPEQRRIVRQRTDRGLGAADLALGRLRIGLLAQRDAVAEGVIADPMALGMSALRASARLGVRELAPDHEERAQDAVMREHVQHHRGHCGLRPVVEGQGEVEHPFRHFETRMRFHHCLHWRECSAVT